MAKYKSPGENRLLSYFVRKRKEFAFSSSPLRLLSVSPFKDGSKNKPLNILLRSYNRIANCFEAIDNYTINYALVS
jgi:hypothetical protein